MNKSHQIVGAITGLSMIALAGCAGQQSVARQETLHLSAGVVQLVSSSASPVNVTDDERIVCSKYRPTGSHFFVTQCQTVSEYRETRERSKQFINSFKTGVRK